MFNNSESGCVSVNRQDSEHTRIKKTLSMFFNVLFSKFYFICFESLYSLVWHCTLSKVNVFLNNSNMCLLLTKVIMLFLGLHSTIFKRLTSILLFVYIQCSVTSYDSEDIITLILQQYFSEDGKRHDSYRYKI